MLGAFERSKMILTIAEMLGAFERSKMIPTIQEAFVAWTIWPRQGRQDPITIAAIIQEARGRVPALNARQVKQIVQQLRVTHRCPIGARREKPAGYFWIVDAEDLEAGLGPYRAQVIEGWRVLRAIAPREWVQELHGQLTFESDE